MTRHDPTGRAHPVAWMLTIVLLLGVLVPAVAVSAAGRPHALPALRMGEYPGETPNYIFPFTPCAHYDVANIQAFQELMYRPLYWFGLGASTTLQPALSLASPPVFAVVAGSGQVTITLKPWKFANGAAVDAASVEFFLNMWKAESAAFCGSSSGLGIPAQVVNVTGAPSGNRVTLQFAKSVNTTNPAWTRWILDDYLAQITPLSPTWDTAHGCAAPGFNSSTTLAACAADWTALDAEATNYATYGVPGGLWSSGVDGPYTLSSYAAGTATLVPNHFYSGPQKATLSVTEVPYISMASEFGDLQASKLQIGYVDPTVLPGPAPAPGKVGPNLPVLNAQFKLETDAVWEYNSVVYNYGSGDAMAPVLSQPYVRQALVTAVDYPSLESHVLKGYAFSNCSSNPPLVSSQLSGAVSCAYPYSVAKAKALLIGHGWTPVAGVMQCTHPGTGAGQCGAGIPNGERLQLSLTFNSGVPSVQAVIHYLATALTTIGVKLTFAASAPFDTMYQQCGGSTFELCWWDGGQLYSRGVYPTGDQNYASGGAANLGAYSNAALDASIRTTHTGPLTGYAKAVATTVPGLFMPDQVLTLEVSKQITYTTPAAAALSPYENFQPEYIGPATPPPTPVCKGTGVCDVAAASPQVICLTQVGCPGGGGGAQPSAAGPRAQLPCGTLNSTTTCVGVTAYRNGKPAANQHVTVRFLSPSTPSSSSGSWCQPQGTGPPVRVESGTTGATGKFYFRYTTSGPVAAATISSFCVMQATFGRARNNFAIDETNDPGPYKVTAAPTSMTRWAAPTYTGRVRVTVGNPVVGVPGDPTTPFSTIPSAPGACGAVTPLVRKTGSTGQAVLVYTPTSSYSTPKHLVACTILIQEAVTAAISNKVVIYQKKPGT